MELGCIDLTENWVGIEKKTWSTLQKDLQYLYAFLNFFCFKLGVE